MSRASIPEVKQQLGATTGEATISDVTDEGKYDVLADPDEELDNLCSHLVVELLCQILKDLFPFVPEHAMSSIISKLKEIAGFDIPVKRSSHHITKIAK